MRAKIQCVPLILNIVCIRSIVSETEQMVGEYEIPNELSMMLRTHKEINNHNNE